MVFNAFMLFCLILVAGCTDQPPDTSAPERVEIDRRGDWQKALLYIADENGPIEGWGSIRVYDNVSGYVEKTVEQTTAAAPSDMFITPDGGSMYVASGANGVIEKFRWDGNNWIDSGVTIETPASGLSMLVSGPDGRLYSAGKTPVDGIGTVYVLDPANDKSPDSAVAFPELAVVTGIAWSPDGSQAYISGKGTGGSRLIVAKWPSSVVTNTVPLPVQEIHEAVLSPDGRTVYILARGEIIKIDTSNLSIAGTYKPTQEPDEDYYDAAFSEDGKFMFVTGFSPGKDGTLYVIDLSSSALVHTVKHVAVKAGGIQRAD
jgi:DNA-binding beta-propeller fold protein YncE